MFRKFDLMNQKFLLFQYYQMNQKFHLNQNFQTNRLSLQYHLSQMFH